MQRRFATRLKSRVATARRRRRRGCRGTRRDVWSLKFEILHALLYNYGDPDITAIRTKRGICHLNTTCTV
jgi:hypothetical protein